ncbi:kinase-like domain-containing protein [Gigaspora rosea]|uniref:Kinase-like domain-containing protein n=1 Tax=Gigaspora rosea TaxID=44941 RepID=A0A397VWH8_9GLOM|nr:kinase-like domain-containing protein [Gigaspora rosea]
MTSFVEFGYIIRCFGVTKCPNSNQYLMVMDYKKDGSLHDYLYKNFKRIKWEQKLDILYFAIKGLSEIHEAELMHKDFHSGNIIISEGVSYISDFGLCQNVSSKTEKQIFGVLPYVDPEVLRGKPYTQASDIYSFGIIMNQVAFGYKPYYDIPHDDDLAFKIACNKIRPEINEKITPKIIVNLIKRCWSEKPSDRPTANELLDELFFYRQRDHEIWSEIESIEENMNFDIPPEKASLDYKPLASYTSQLITVSQEITSQVSQEIASDTSKRISVSSIPDG